MLEEKERKKERKKEEQNRNFYIRFLDCDKD